MSEVLKYEGRLARLKKEEAELVMLCRGDVRTLREYYDPFEDPGDLETDAAAAKAVELAGRVIQLKETRLKIKAIEKELGR